MGKRGRSLKRLDMYGTSIGFNFGESDTYQTYFGASLTIIVVILIIYYSSITTL